MSTFMSPVKTSQNTLDTGELLKAADKAALDFCVFKHNADSPMPDASLARLFYKHIPNFVKMESEFSKGIKPSDDALMSAKSLSKSMENDMIAGREFSSWLSAHLSKTSADLFAEGGRNSLNPVFDKLAEIGGFERNDILSKEAKMPSVSDERRQQNLMLSQQAVKNMGIG